MTRLLFSPKSGTFSRGILAKLTQDGLLHRDFVAQDNGNRHPSAMGSGR